MKTLILCFLLLVSAATHAQLPLVVDGMVIDSSGQGMPQQSVDILLLTNLGAVYGNTVITDNNGYFTDSVGITNPGMQGTLVVSTLTCHGDSAVAALPWTPNMFFFTVVLEGCPDTSTTNTGCQASFTYIDSSLTVYFNNTSPSGQYTWSFGDGTSSTQQHPVHNYNQPGTYQICLTIVDSTCTATFCDTLTVTGSNSQNCHAAFTWQQNPAGGSIQFNSQSTGSVLTHFWDFGDSSYSTFINPTHMFSQSGYQLVCLTIVDTVNNCTDTHCDSVWVNNPAGNCLAAFSFQVLQGTTVQFSNQSSGGINYWWSFGDGTTSTQQNPVHSYNGFGPYLTCLVVYDSLSGCVDSSCLSITFAPQQNGHIGGLIFTPNNGNYLLADEAMVYLITHDSANGGILTAIDSQLVTWMDSSFYLFTNVPQGDYLVKAALTPNSSQYANYLPTYYDSVLYWNQATVINPSTYVADIYLIGGTNPGGPGFIGGLVAQGANKQQGPGDPYAGASVLLLTDQGEPVTHTVSGMDGSFSFSDIALGSYLLQVEIPGKTSQTHAVVLDSQTDSVTTLVFTVNRMDITTGLLRPIEKPSLEVSLYPNPTTDNCQIRLDEPMHQPADLLVMDATGRIIRNMTGWVQGHGQTQTLDIHRLPAGLYRIEIRQQGQLLHQQAILRLER